MTDAQTFGSSVKHPWALTLFGSNQPNGRRPGTSVFYITDDEGDCWLGGYVEWYRRKPRMEYDPTRRAYVETRPGDTCARWHYRYKRAKRIHKSDVLHIFPVVSRTAMLGPTQKQVRTAKRAVPVNQEEAA